MKDMLKSILHLVDLPYTKIDRIIKIKYDSENGLNCEHVKFNENLNEQYGGLMLDKQLTNSNGINKHTITGILASKINYFSKRFFSNLTKVYLFENIFQ